MGKVPALAILLGLASTLIGCQAKSPSSNSSGESRGAVAANRPERTGVDAEADAPGGEAAAVNPSHTDDSRPVLVCFGDSLTAGLGTGPGQGYPDYLQADLDKVHSRYRVVNEGISGNTTKDGVARLPEILALHPTVAVVEFGGNDGLRGLRVEDTRANLDTIVGTLKKAGVKVALAGITLPPDYGPDYIQKFDETYDVLAKKYRVPLLPFLLKDVYGVPGMMQRDETHATAKGNVVVAQNVLSLVTPLLKR
jgi:acyl-CoA thioesterase I